MCSRHRETVVRVDLRLPLRSLIRTTNQGILKGMEKTGFYLQELFKKKLPDRPGYQDRDWELLVVVILNGNIIRNNITPW